MFILGLFVMGAVVLLALLFLIGLKRLVAHFRKILANSDRPNIMHGATFWLSGIFFIIAFIVIGFFWGSVASH